MLAHRGAEAVRLTRREAGRLVFAAVLLVVAMTALLGADFAPRRVTLEVGARVPADIVAPRARTFPNDVLTEQARQDAADAVQPQYDFTPYRAITIASAQVAAFEAGVRLLDTAFDPATTEVQRGLIVDRVASDLSTSAADTLAGLEISRW